MRARLNALQLGEISCSKRRMVAAFRALSLRPGRRHVISFGLLLSFWSADAHSCGPCGVAEFWAVEEFSGAPAIVANFGVLTSNDEGGFRLTCEEAVGGLMLDFAQASGGSWISTSQGLYVAEMDLCEWEPGPQSRSNDWLLRLRVAQNAEGRPTDSYALLIFDDALEPIVERSVNGEDFEVLHSFDGVTGFRELAVGGEPAAVYVGGYHGDVRAYTLEFSLDGGGAWERRAPQAFDNLSTTMILELVDPRYPRGVYLRAKTPAADPDELFYFDSETGEAERVLTLESNEVLSGIALLDDGIWVSGRHPKGGSLYRADRQARSFERLEVEAPRLDCLSAVAGKLYGCVNDLSYESPFLVGASADGGMTWEPYFTVADLGAVTSCGEVCSTTTSWLYSSFGLVSEELEPDGVPELEPAPKPRQDAGASPPTPSSSKAGGCAQLSSGTHPREGFAVSLLAFGLMLVGVSRRVGCR